jgi:protease-4
MKRRLSPILRLFALGLLLVVLPLILGSVMAPRLVPTPKVGVIRFWTDIWYWTAQDAIDQLALARSDPSIKAVVIIVDSPGGEVSSSEDLYLSILHTREEVPVVVTVDYLAASGAYLLSVAADEIYAKPTSLVGNIGVIGYVSLTPYIDEQLLTTGPYKAFGGTQAGRVQQMEMAKESFLAAVEAGRDDRLNVSLDYLSRGEIFSGVQALKLGMIDGTISTDEATVRAAELAEIRNYETVDLWELTFPDRPPYVEYFFFGSDVDNSTSWTAVEDLPPGLYYRYVELPH